MSIHSPHLAAPLYPNLHPLTLAPTVKTSGVYLALVITAFYLFDPSSNEEKRKKLLQVMRLAHAVWACGVGMRCAPLPNPPPTPPPSVSVAPAHLLPTQHTYGHTTSGTARAAGPNL